MSAFRLFIDSSYVNTIDVEKNTRIGFDIDNKPIYQAPIIYKSTSPFINVTNIDSESAVRTVFMPNNVAVNTAFAKMLAARGGMTNLVVPRITPGRKHPAMILPTAFIPKDAYYEGDSTTLLNNMFRHVVIPQKITSLANGVNTFTNIMGNQFSVSPAQVVKNATISSNGVHYILNDVTLPEIFYRTKFVVVPVVGSPNIVFSGGASTSYSRTQNSTCYTDGYHTFNLSKLGGRVEFVIPFMTKGSYKINLKNFLSTNGCIVDVSSGSQIIKQNINTSQHFTAGSYMVELDGGVLNVATDGEVRLAFTASGASTKNGSWQFLVDMIDLIPQ